MNEIFFFYKRGLVMYLRFSCSVSLALAAVFALGLQSAQAFTVVPTNNASVLVNNLLAPNSGLTILSSSYVGSATASGTFTAGGNIGIGDGVLLTTGSAAGAAGTNNSASFSVNNNLAGDSQLTTLAGAQTFDASTLNFSFTTNTGSISFVYTFGSEEYPEFVNAGFNDVFAFYVNGSANLAVVPGTSTPVSIDTINATTNSSFYRSNASATISTQYDGLTTVLTATISGLSTTATNTLKISIADGGDGIYDSGIFLRAASLSSSAVPVPEPSPLIAVLAFAANLCGLVAFKRVRDRNIQTSG
jgi:hypothetical protein